MKYIWDFFKVNKVKFLQFLFYLLILTGMTSISNSADASVTGEVIEPTTLRQLDSDNETLVLISELEDTNFQLPLGTKLAFTVGNFRQRSPFEDDENPGEIIDMSRGEWQQHIRIDVLPGYADDIRELLNEKRIFISAGIMQSRIRLDAGFDWVFQGLSGGDTSHRCYSRYVNRALTDQSLTTRVKENFSSILAKSFEYYYRYQRRLSSNYITFIDYSVPSSHRRFFLFNLNNCTYISEFVAHGGSGLSHSVATPSRLRQCATGTRSSTRYSRTRHGVFKTNGWHWSGLNWPVLFGNFKGIKLASLNGFNSDVMGQGVVMHEAPRYVSNSGRAQGRSKGCPAFARNRLKTHARKIYRDTLVYIHAPQCGDYGS